MGAAVDSLGSCTFYFDESYHDRKICIAEDSLFNIWRDDRSHDKYVGCFVGWPSGDLRLVREQYEDFEAVYRKVFTILDRNELKSDVVKDKQYRNGLASFSRNSLRFYSDFFDFLMSTNVMWQVNILSKIELFLRDGLHFYDFRCLYSDEVVIYAIAKFFEAYADTELLRSIAKFCNGSIQGYQCRKAILKRLNEVIEYNRGCLRKRAETSAYLTLYKLLKVHPFVWYTDTVCFDYSPNYLGLKFALCEYGLQPDDVFVFMDAEQSTFESVSSVFSDTIQVDSAECFGVRVADLLAGFIARMLHALNVVLSPTSFVLSGVKASEDNMWIPDSWFDFYRRPDVFDLYKKVANVMLGDSLPYWTVLSSFYGDEVSCFFSLLRYMNQFSDFDAYCKVEKSEHCRACNKFSVAELHARINSF